MLPPGRSPPVFVLKGPRVSGSIPWLGLRLGLANPNPYPNPNPNPNPTPTPSPTTSQVSAPVGSALGMRFCAQMRRDGFARVLLGPEQRA